MILAPEEQWIAKKANGGIEQQHEPSFDECPDTVRAGFSDEPESPSPNKAASGLRSGTMIHSISLEDYKGCKKSNLGRYCFWYARAQANTLHNQVCHNHQDFNVLGKGIMLKWLPTSTKLYEKTRDKPFLLDAGAAAIGPVSSNQTVHRDDICTTTTNTPSKDAILHLPDDVPLDFDAHSESSRNIQDTEMVEMAPSLGGSSLLYDQLHRLKTTKAMVSFGHLRDAYRKFASTSSCSPTVMTSRQ
ncbi:hypothetical protein ACLX1H_010878 [Fusarium chlamydosporum]